MKRILRSRAVRLSYTTALTAAALLASARAVSAQTTVVLPDTSQTTTLTATVGEQARVSFPASLTFSVTDIASSTTSSTGSVTVTNIVLATAAKQLRMSLEADAAAFTPPVGGATSWSAGDVSWGAVSWTNATGTAGTLSNASYNVVATCTADVSSCSTSALAFSLAANTNVKRSGNHTLVVRCKVEAI